MFGYQYRHDLLKRYIAIFGALFNGITIERYDSQEEVWHTVKVPVSYGPREKLLESARKEFGDPKQAIATTGPRIAFEEGPIYFDNARVMNKFQKVPYADHSFSYTATPWNIEFSVYIAAKNKTDANRIVEQILPHFSPHITLQMKPLSDHQDHKKDIQIWLQGASQEDVYEGEPSSRQLVMWTLNFVLKGFLYGPVFTGGIIKRVEVNMRPTNETTMETIIVRPGMTSGGQPTTDPLLSIDSMLIDEEDNWDFIIEYDQTP